MTSKSGLGLIEILISLAIFGLLVAAISGGLLSSMNLRRINQEQMNAQQYAGEIIELHKDYWSVEQNYEENTLPSNANFTNLQSRRPDFVKTVTLTYTCLSSSGSSLSGSGPLGCSTTNPDLRRLTIEMINQNDKVIAHLVTEVGRPY